MSIILQGMDGVMCYLDDILIFASDSKTHDRILRLVLRKLKEAKVTLNKAKCVFGVTRINFLGHILDEDGIRPDPAKIEAVAKMPAPTDVHGVRRFLGMVNHLGRFVENLSEIVAPLNQLLVKGQDFVWDCSQERAFRKLKELLTTQPILAAYDVRKPTMVSSDASSYGLGAVLKQEGKNGIWRPVAYSSRTMTPTEKRYAQIEKEALAITWACERFQDFLLGKRFRIETDHKPLIPLFSTKELSSLTPRLQRFRMRMMRFGFEIVHIPGKELLDADALSRQPLLTTEGGEDERPTSAHINAVLSSITDKDEMLTKIFEAQQEDTTLKAVVNYLEQGWPDKKKMSQALLSYWHVKDELGVQNGLLMRSCRLVIPASMKLEILDKLHAGHFGITKTRLRARETVWWPGISEEIAETVRKCSVCIQEAVSKHEPLIPTNFPTRPWQKIGMDLFKFENKWYLVVIDYYSRFPEMIQLDRLTASVVVRSCKSIFARHGIPETVVSDNGTQFEAAREFANFARQYGFTHVTSSPRFPQSNGMEEAGVKIAKLILKKNQDPSLGLLEYRSTPLENGCSPAEILMGGKLRTTLPIAPENLNPKLVDSQTLKRKEGRRRKDMKSRYDRRCGATDMEELSEAVENELPIGEPRIWYYQPGQLSPGHDNHGGLTPRIHRRVKAKTSLQDDDVPIVDTTTKPLFTPQEKGRKATRDKVPRLRWNPWQKHVRSMSVTTKIASFDLEDHAITISSAAKYEIYVFFVDGEIRGVAGDPLASVDFLPTCGQQEAEAGLDVSTDRDRGQPTGQRVSPQLVRSYFPLCLDHDCLYSVKTVKGLPKCRENCFEFGEQGKVIWCDVWGIGWLRMMTKHRGAIVLVDDEIAELVIGMAVLE
ncbi:K02A2.6-like [Cordylochernes scorpioides]|uniref:RNA-directed DNA polymerase n=1 Tax=Cordylochernes scorpioides TaxID=51811 RepID=A0ABY6K501_9ARAC|nr:K02A2.6-like [Cordylochernes scorpioides]